MKTTYKDLLLKRVNKLTDFEREWAEQNLRGWYNRYVLDVPNSEEYSGSVWESLWCFSVFGQCHLRNQSLAKKFLSSDKKMNYVMDMMEDRKTWYATKVHIIKNLHTTGKLTQNIMSFIISHMTKHDFNIFESYVNDPIFETGGIVQFRSNIGVDAVVVENSWMRKIQRQYYGATRSELKEIKNKTMMVLGESPPLDAKCYANAYSYKEKQGGSRLYRVLPVGDTKVYIVVEKFLKKCRTKAVKDARK